MFRVNSPLVFSRQLGEVFDMLGKRAALTPERDVPFSGGGFGGERGDDGRSGGLAQKSGHGFFSL